MKPTSIIFLCLAVLLTVGGIVTCYIAAGMADDAGIELFETSESTAGENVVKNILDEEGLNKISLIIKEADVTVRGGAAEPYIEFINFGTNTYSYTIANGILTVDESVGFLSLLNFTNTSVNFGGLRQYLNWRSGDEGKRSVNIFLTDDYPVKQLEFKIENGEVNVSNVKNRSDYSFIINRGDLLFTGNKTNSSVAVDIGYGNVIFRDSNPATLNVSIKQGDFKFFSQNYAYQNYNIITESGAVYLEGDNKGESLSASTPMAFIKITAELDSGDAFIGAADPDEPPAGSDDIKDSETSGGSDTDTAAETAQGAV